MKKVAAAIAVFCTFAIAGTAYAGGWSATVPFTNQVASSPTSGGGYPVPPGSRVPLAGTCGPGPFDANHSESWIAAKPGSENLLGSSKFFFDKYSTFYMFYLGSYRILGGTPTDNKQIEGFDCVSTGTQDMPPSWTNTTDPNVDFDTKGRAYQTMLPFNAFWDATKLHPDGEIDMIYTDDLGQHWVKGNGGQPLEPSNNASAKQFGHVEDKQWVAVNHIKGNKFQDHVYAMWTVYNGQTAKIRGAISSTRGVTFDKSFTLSAPAQTGSYNEFVYPAIDAAGNVYAVYHAADGRLFVTFSSDDGTIWAPFVLAATANLIPTAGLPNTRFRDGILENFAASPTYAGHVYLTYEDWNGTSMDVKFKQSTDFGQHWSAPVTVNDDGDATNDQFQPSVAAGPKGAVAIAFYDRRLPCPADPSVLPADQGRTNFCIDTSLQAYKDSGGGAVPVGGNVRISEFTWDPEQPGQKLDGISQYPCAGARDPCPTGRGFIGDYFGLAISANNIYAFPSSTHYPSDVKGDGNKTIYYQQQVLSSVPRSAFGADY